MTAASLATYGCAEALGLSEGFWAIITALIVTQSNVGGSLKAALERFAGSVLGAVYGAAVASLIPHSAGLPRAVALVVAIAPLSFLASVSAGFRIAPITAVIVLLASIGVPLGPLGFAEERVLEVGLGCAVGLLVSVLVVPARASRSVIDTASEVARLLAEQLELLGNLDDEAQARRNALATQTRQSLSGLVTQVGEAASERRAHLTDLPNPGPLLRTLIRLRHDVTMLRRAVGRPRQEGACGGRPAPDWRPAAEAGAAHLRVLADALENGRPPERSDTMAKAIGAYRATMDGMRQDAPDRQPSTDTLWWLFGAGFALEQFRRDLDDLAERIKDHSTRQHRQLTPQ